MRAAVIERFGEPGELHALEVDDPPLAPDGVLIRVAAAGVNPVDAKIREGAQAESFPYIFPAILGWDAAGVGPSIVGFAVGEEVIAHCRKDFVGHGAYAELVSPGDADCAARTAYRRAGGGSAARRAHRISGAERGDRHRAG
jgi:NADPH:quinone reductase-like Zn-dependent oxidoreductase